MKYFQRKHERDKALSAKDEVEQQLEDCRKRMSEILQSHKEEVTQLKQKLMKSQEMEARALATKEKFLSMMSHEIRTPMNAILGMTHLLFDTPTTELQREYLDNLKSSSEILKGLISDLLNLSNIQSRTLEFCPVKFNMEALLSKVVKSHAQVAVNKGLTISCSVGETLPNWLLGDSELLEKIIHAWIDNAVKFTEKGEISVKLEVVSKSEKAALCKLEVRDTGMGIEEHELSRIFDFFEQGDSTVHLKYGGAGIGLTLSKQLADLCEAKIKVSSNRGVGSCFELLFPLALVEERFKEKPEAERLNLEKRKCVLVVEDNLLNQQYVCKLLEKWGVDYEVAENGLLALNCVRENDYDLILMDVQMPEIDGNEATEKIRLMEGAKGRIPIIGLSAYSFSQDVERSVMAGMDDYLSKPYSPSQLKNFLDQYLHLSEVEIEKHTEYVLGSHFDQSALDDYFNGDVKYMYTVFKYFEEHTPDNVERLKSLLKTLNWTELGKLAHQMKPSFSMVGAPKCSEILKMMERSCKLTNPVESVMHVQMGDFLLEYQNLIPLLKQEILKLESFLCLDTD